MSAERLVLTKSSGEGCLLIIPYRIWYLSYRSFYNRPGSLDFTPLLQDAQVRPQYPFQAPDSIFAPGKVFNPWVIQPR